MDDEGEMGAAFNAKAAVIRTAQNSILKMSSTPVNTNNHGYTVRIISKIIKSIGRASISGFQYIAEEYRKYKENVNLDPFEVWDTSGDKTEISCFIESDSGARELIGIFAMDLDAPCNVMRLYLRKQFRERLNEITGDSFLFFGIIENSETILDREVEEHTESRVYVELKIDDVTEHRVYSVFIMRDKSAEIMHIPEFDRPKEQELNSHVEEPKLNEKLSTHYI